MSDSDDNYESDDDSWCYSIGAASDLSEPRLISADDDFLNPSLSTSSGRSSPSSSVGSALSVTDDDDEAGMMDIEEDDDDTSDTSTPLDDTEYEMDDIGDDEIIVLSDGDDIMGTVAHSQPPTTFNGPMSTLSASHSTTSKCTEEETAARSQPSPTFNRPMSMLSTFSSTTSTCTEDETVTASCSSESNGEDNFSSSSIKNYLPPCLSTHKLCFDNGIEIDRILGAVVHNTQLLFRVRWRNDKNGGTDYVDAFEMHERCPHMALQFYNERYKNENTDKTDK
ncbi:uncharacterized protein LOC100574567 [Acyrthosiphon pisum]|uniref:Chromo domain-containing protein n=1 Tax=Acyrthosiphon pisum TaxID=7029 RepID=A0A8R1W6S5_ACYPI|nr:uncharacterized protein LOC100574567 [Acyrthosiphon pisum]|eukprot:XP_003246503.1 PREDICTED: uncharacterized protein LOC100574567 [Acyrthosiphon pisum]